MKKVILKLSSKTKKKTNKELFLSESSIKVGDIDYERRLRKRLTDLRRAKDLVDRGIETAKKENHNDLVNSLVEKSQEIQKLIDEVNTDLIDEENIDDNKHQPKSNSNDLDNDSELDLNDLDDEPNTKPNTKPNDEPNEPNDEEEEEEETDESTDDEENNEDPDNDSNGDNDSEEDSEENTTDLDNSNNSEEQDENNEDSEENLANSNDEEEPNDSDSQENDSDEDTSSTEDSGNEEDSEDEENSENSTEEGSSNNEDSNNQEEDENNSETNSEDESENEEDDSEDELEDDEDEPEDDEDLIFSDDEDDENESEDDDEPIKDPFADEEDIPSPVSYNNDKEPKDATLDDIINQLTDLNAKSKQGAIAAIKDLLAKADEETNESFKLDFTKKSQLVEALKSVREMTDDEFGDYINGVYDLIDQVEEIEYVDDVEERKGKIKAWADDPMTAQELAAEDNIEIQKDQQAIRASEKEKQKYSRMGSLDEFSIDLFNAIDYQIDLVKQVYLSYEEPNVEYEDSDLIMRTEIEKEVPDEAWPIIDIYFDVSGSWTSQDIKTGMQAIASIKKFEDAGELVVNIFYWDDQVSNNQYLASYKGGTSGWQKVLANIRATNASNVMIMTDSDIAYYDAQADKNAKYKQFSAKYGPSVMVDGCVWYLWKQGQRSPECVKKLTGKQGTYQYSF